MNVVTHAAGVSRGILSLRDRAIVFALAQAAIPQGALVAGGGEATVFRLEEWLTGIAPGHTRAFRGLLWGAEMAAVVTTGTMLSKLPRERAMEFLESWAASGLHVGRSLLRALLTPIKAAHFDDPSMFAQVGCPSFHGNQVPQQEQPRWMSQVTDGRGCDADLELECEVVVIGTGAGGAACAYELASRGRAVLLLEEGDFHRRSGFTGRSRAMVNALYRDRGLTVALGNVGIPVFAGRAVGGSTTVNSGTCYRAPERIFRKWR
ncbi:MAG: FAD-dependent oxidoreductase, partial [Myxococcales bacterium]